MTDADGAPTARTGDADDAHGIRTGDTDEAATETVDGTRTGTGDATDDTRHGRDSGDRDHGSTRPVYAPPDDDSFDWRGWLLVALVFVCFLVIPGAILLLPAAQGFLASLGLSLRDAYLTLPLIPALVLGAVAVWSAVASRRA